MVFSSSLCIFCHPIYPWVFFSPNLSIFLPYLFVISCVCFNLFFSPGFSSTLFSLLSFQPPFSSIISLRLQAIYYVHPIYLLFFPPYLSIFFLCFPSYSSYLSIASCFLSYFLLFFFFTLLFFFHIFTLFFLAYFYLCTFLPHILIFTITPVLSISLFFSIPSTPSPYPDGIRINGGRKNKCREKKQA